ncbi:hypothetical protein L0128_09720 [candidate division KSB1 bacterium]|nr:hypothetical protein [candidate division KSB1 bacterium]
MHSKARVQAALRRQPTDRIPIFMWFHPQTTQLLARTLEIPPDYVGEAMGNDVAQTWINNNFAMEGITHEHDGETHTDFWGIEWMKMGPFNQIIHSPLSDKSVAEILNYQFPTGHLETLLQPMQAILEKQHEFFIGCDVSPCIFEMYCRLRGMEMTLLDIAAEKALTRKMFTRGAEFAKFLAEVACQRFPLDWLWTGDDVASQLSLMLHPDHWRELVKPLLQAIVAVGKRHGLWVAYHCCGALRPIIPDLIEIGIEVLNPIQCNCPGMEPLSLKAEFSAHLAFMGGVDTEYLLPKGTVSEVRAATRRLIDGMTQDGGGYILAASHTIPPETPLDNIFALYTEAGISPAEILDQAATIRFRLSARPIEP